MISMTQDQRGPGYVVRGDAVPENETETETEEYASEQDKPMTRFQKVASALRGGSERDEHDPAEADRDIQADRDLQSDQSRHDYWDEPVASGQPAGPGVTRPVDPVTGQAEGVAAMDPGVPVDETHPDVPVSETTPVADDHPDVFGNTAHGTSADPDAPIVPAAEGQPGAATIADAPAGASVATATGAEEPGVPDVATPAAEAAGSTGRHAAAAQADRELRPGEATVALGDFSDLTYGDLVPDAEQFAAQWQQIQFRFVDDPHASVSEAAEVVAQVTAKMEAAIQERQRAIAERQKAIAEQQRSLRERWGEGNNADTENLRATLRMYKTFLDQLIGSKATS
jgi:hypothetical protein